MTRVAGIDCGTNSIRLLIAELGSAGLTDVHREMRVVRLGEGVDRTGLLAPQALERTRLALVDYAALIKRNGVDRVRMVATSASRDAGNAAEFSAMVLEALGTEPEVISGLAEASLSFVGAVAGLRVQSGLRVQQSVQDSDSLGSASTSSGPLLVADIGGGSTELVLGSAAQQKVIAAHSMDVGCVRLTERHLHTDPPLASEIEATLADLHQALAVAGGYVPVADAVGFVGVAGTVTTIAAIALGLLAYDPVAIHGSVISYRQVVEVTAALLSMTRAERAALPVMHPGRVDVIGGGALVLQAVMEFVGAEQVLVSEHDILDGIALSLR